MRPHPSSSHPAPATVRRRLGAAATVATLALGSALAGAGTAAAVADGDASIAAEGAPGAPRLAVSLTVHSEDRRAVRPGGGAEVERVRTVRFAWRSR